MKKIEATVRPSVFQDIKEALRSLNVNVITIGRVETFVPDQPMTRFHRTTDIGHDTIAQIKIDVIVDDAIATRVRDTIVNICHSAKLRDGSVLVFDIAEALDLRAGRDHSVAMGFGGAAANQESPRTQKTA